MTDIERKTQELCAAIRESHEYREFTRLRDEAMSNDTQKALIDEYKKLQFKLQVAMAGGGSGDPDDMERLKRIVGVLQFSPEAAQYLAAEMMLQKSLADIFQQLAQVAQVDLDMLRG